MSISIVLKTTSDITQAEAEELLTIIGAARQVIAELKRQFAIQTN